MNSEYVGSTEESAIDQAFGAQCTLASMISLLLPCQYIGAQRTAGSKEIYVSNLVSEFYIYDHR